MILLNTSKDLLNIAIAASVVGFTVFLCWTIYYFAMILRQAFFGIKEMRERLHKIDEVIKSIKDKVESSVSYLLLISEGMKKLVEVVKTYSGKKSANDDSDNKNG
jgi:hypothetical protein